MLKIGTDCSGIEAPIQALINLNVIHDHIFSCEIDKYARQSILANYRPKVLYEDITTDKKEHLLDMYVCGFPCQPFSLSGNRKGSDDPRGNIFDHCIKNIRNTNTKIFVLENVRGIISIDNGKYWEYVLNELKKLDKYNVCFKLLNTRHYGIPQNRERIYIVGIRKDVQEKQFIFPEHTIMKDIKMYVDKDTTNIDPEPVKNIEVMKIIRNSKATFLNLGWQNFKEHSYENFSPSIIAQASIWCVPMHRKATIKELLSLQGFPKDFKQVVSDTQIKKQIGNSMSVNVLEHLFREIFQCINLDV